MTSVPNRARRWLERLNGSKHMLWLLALFSFLETLIVPVPIELVLIPLMVRTQFEIGAKGVFNRGLTNYNLALFRITDDNRAIQDPANPAFSVAGGKVRAQGVEAEIAGQVSERIQVLTGYAYTDTEQLESDDPNAEGKPFAPDSPEHSLKLWGKYTFNPSWEAGLGAQYSSGTFAESGGVRWEQNGYTTFSAMAAYNLNADTRFVLTGSNLTDKRYYSRVQGGGRQNYFGDARQFKLSFETRF